MSHPILERDVQFIKGVGPRRAELLRKLGLGTLGQLVQHIPRAYLDYSQFKRCRDLVPDELASLEVQVTTISTRRLGGRRTVVNALFGDGTGYVRAAWWNQPWLEKQLPPGTTVILSGKVKRERGAFELENPNIESLGEDAELLHAGRIIPVYPLTEGLRPREMRRLMREAVEQAAPHMPEWVPEPLRRRRALLSLPAAWQGVHWPENWDHQRAAIRTIKYQELFLMQAGLAMLRQRVETRQGIGHGPAGERWQLFRAALPFTLTAGQEQAIREIHQDMAAPRPMNRLIQGDVGSGKTVVAAAAIVRAVESGHQAALMAPTEILAEQHYFGLRRLLEPLGIHVVPVLGGQGKKAREHVLSVLRSLPGAVAVGTHALIEGTVEFADLSLVVIDEQHRFGVRQRALLQAKRRDGRHPDVLVMTATPIPRTVAMTLYGDLDISLIKEKPPGRQEIITVWRKPTERDHVYSTLMEHVVARGQQAYVIAPLVEESEKLEAQAATALYEELGARYPHVRFGLMHGRLKPDAKDATMEAFRRHELDVLVSTTVVEVGVDVPNATAVIIEEADRFGLAQLHQLRGRVGRGRQKSYCVLVADPKTDDGVERMMTMQATGDGFALAEKDLELRGPGEYLGTAQSGWGLQFANLIRDRDLLEEARADAAALVASGRLQEHPEVIAAVNAQWGARLGLALVG